MQQRLRNPDMIWLLFSPSGRLSRRTYGLALCLWFALQGIVISQMFANEGEQTALALWTLALVGIILGWILSSLMLTVKRMHDLGLPGYWALLLALPVIGLVTMIALIFMPSDGPNHYGLFPDAPGRDW
ncbi:DUF805 domain-containing protein [Rhizobium alvei]|uniref:DUF805 domain-containing protein n=1 Tax=Rhizobium alvei TaxID=1132659 RepID=A0ABT8YN67_9HYPH|nr:DUF805 domain-containing protein [Rhizobium alvei]MDO6965175.1 DUF805 domain-containing protein [Rhizobium alvei]